MCGWAGTSFGEGGDLVSCCGDSAGLKLLRFMFLCWILWKEACAKIITLMVEYHLC